MDSKHTGEVVIGDLAPDFHLPASSGGEIALSDYRGSKRVVVFFVTAAL